jgi:hypothetical protein
MFILWEPPTVRQTTKLLASITVIQTARLLQSQSNRQANSSVGQTCSKRRQYLYTTVRDLVASTPTQALANQRPQIQQKRDKCSPRQFNHLDFIAQFTTDLKHISGQDNVADTLSCVESITVPPSHDALAASQDSDDELRTLLGSTTTLRLEKLQIPGTAVSIYCDTSTGRSRTYVPAPLWLQVFKSVHEL